MVRRYEPHQRTHRIGRPSDRKSSAMTQLGCTNAVGFCISVTQSTSDGRSPPCICGALVNTTNPGGWLHLTRFGLGGGLVVSSTKAWSSSIWKGSLTIHWFVG